MKDLEGKVALVTGAGQGIGQTIAEVLSKAGAKVVVTGRKDNLGMAVADGIKKAGGKALFCHLDVTREDEWAAAVEKSVVSFGGLDIIVNNAGTDEHDLIENCTVELWDSAMANNAKGSFLGIKHGILAMKPGGISGKGGSIINISSIVSWIGIPATAPYSASKGAVRALTKVAAVECAKLQYGIRVNSVNPGVVRTPFAVEGFARIAKDAGTTPEKIEEQYIAQHPIGRLATTDDVAQAVLYLASDASSFVTGTELLVDGGFTAQ
jgi:3alpha(or 20beta)-hydroxysteroid dehydrogenase